MKIEIAKETGYSLVKLEGNVDAKTATEVQTAIVPLAKESPRVIVEMSGVSYMSSAGLRVMLLLYRQSVASKSQVVLVGVLKEIQEVMKVTGFLGFFTLADSVETAKALVLK